MVIFATARGCAICFQLLNNLGRASENPPSILLFQRGRGQSAPTKREATFVPGIPTTPRLKASGAEPRDRLSYSGKLTERGGLWVPANPECTAVKRITLLVVIMTVVAMSVGAATIAILYETAFEQQRQRLVETAKTQAKLSCLL